METIKKFLNEFKEFALRGNVLDLAIGVIIGGAFQTIINSLVKDVMSPIIGLVAKTDLSYLVLTLNGVDIKYGAFLTAVINFVIMVFVIFLLVKGINTLASLGRRKEEEEAPTTKKCPFCQSEISIKATKCPHCTSDIPEEDEEAEAEAATTAE